ncbi:MAG: hypothetical protein EPN84_03520 [Legionella sp.]|nr:MAG: hypothetical protein EPN84_03520 [Legionella sp.]
MESSKVAYADLEKNANSFYWNDKKKPREDLVNIRLLSRWDLDLQNLDESMMIKMLGVAQHNQLDWLKNGIEGNIPLHLVHPEGHTVLTIASQSGARDVVEYLLDLGLNPAFHAEKGMQYNAYFAACAGGQFAIIDYLLKHPNQQITLEMREPRHHQSGLQIAVHNLRFACAKQMIQNYPDVLTLLDKLNRSVMATFLSIFVTSTFNNHIEGKGLEPQMEDCGLFLLNYENPFTPIAQNAMPAMQVVLQSASASFHKANPDQLMSPLNAIRTIHLACPKLGEALFNLAQQNPHGRMEYHFIKHSEKHFADVKTVREHIAKLKKDKPESESK